MKKSIFLKFLLIIIFIGCDKDNIEAEQPGVTGDFMLNENAHVIEEVSSLVSTSEQIQQGIYIFNNLSEEISIGDIIVGSHNDGFLRKINTVTSSNGQMTFTTSRAYLDDLFESSDILIDFNTMLSEELPPTANRSLNISKSNNSREGLSFELDNYEVSLPNGSVLLNGYINFDANYNVNIKTSSVGLDSFKLNTNGSTLDLSLTSNIHINNSTSNTISQSLYSFKRRFGSVYPPVYGAIEFDLVLVLTYESSAEYNAELHGRRKIGLEANINYEQGNWQTNLNTSNLISEGFATFEEQLSTSQVKLRLIPKIDIKMYGTVTPKLHPEVFVGFKSENTVDEQCNEYENWDSNVFLGIGGSIGVNSQVLGIDIIDINRSLPEQRINIWEAPETLQEISGNNQLLAAGTDSEPLIVRVLDDSGNPVQGVNVYYQVEEISCIGIQEECINNNISNRQVSVTDENGYASAIFNEALIDYDTLITATIKNSQGELITIIPFFLTSELANQNVIFTIPDIPYPTEPIEFQNIFYSIVNEGGYCQVDTFFGQYLKFNFCKIKNISSIDVETSLNCGANVYLGLFDGDIQLDCFYINSGINNTIIQNLEGADNIRFFLCHDSSVNKIEFHR